MNQTCVRCARVHPYGHRDATGSGWWYCEDCWQKSVGLTRLCNSCKRHSQQGTVSYVDQFWYCNDCWDRRNHPPGGYSPPPSPSPHAITYPGYHPQPAPVVVPYGGRPHDRYGRREASRSPDGRRKGQKRLRDSTPQRKEAHRKAALETTEPTTLMLRNLPRPLTRDMLMDLLKDEGFELLINFIYVPMNFQAGENFGYGFINLTTHEEAERCRETLQGFTRWPAHLDWDKACDVGNGETCQGVEGHIERYRNSPVMHESVPEEHKPALYDNGVRKPFPKPTKQLKKPHIRARKGKDKQQPTDADETG